MRKKILSLALTLALSLSLAVPALAVSVTEIPTQYAAVTGQGAVQVHFSEGLACVGKEAGMNEELGYPIYQYGYIDTTGKEVIPCQYSAAGDFIGGLALVWNESGKCGYIDKTGKEVIPCQYDFACDFSEGLALVQGENGKWGYIDTTGKLVIPCQYDSADDFSEGLAAVKDESGKWGCIDTTGKLVIPCQYNNRVENFSDGMARVMDTSGKWGYIDTTGELVIPYQFVTAYDFSEGLAAARYDYSGKWGYIDKTGKEAIPFQYYDAYSFSEGLAAVQDVSGYGYIDTTGKLVIPCQFSTVSNFSEGLAAVWDGIGQLGYIDTTGELAIPYQYNGLDDRSIAFSDGVAVVSDGDFNAVILNLNGVDQPEEPSAPSFADVADGAYYADAVAWAVEKGITTGTSDTTFSPDTTCTTAQILTFLWRASGSPAPAGSDASIPAGQYYSDAANWALEQGITDSFTADDPATRLATVTYLWKLAGSPEAAGENPFTDLTGDAQAVVWAMNEGITSGTSDTTFAPDSICTRGQIVTFLYRDLAE